MSVDNSLDCNKHPNIWAIEKMSGNDQISSPKTAAEWISARWPHRPRFGVVLGTGAGEVANAIQVEQEFAYQEIPTFPTSTAVGHAGKLICGELCGQKIIAMKGRFHLYEGYSVETTTIGIRVMHQLGVKKLFISNAAGGINPNFESGDIMIIDSHVDLMFRADQSKGIWQLGRTFANQTDSAYDQEMAHQAMACARKNDFAIFRGVYVSMLGPNYETRSEYRFLKKIGGDTVGMSTVPEVAIASQMGMRVLALSVVTNVAKPDALEATSGDEVVAFADVAAPKLRLIIENAIREDVRR
ncbi:MAG: purine-nucleoside phosphorylase [Pirellulaceae bacterium]